MADGQGSAALALRHAAVAPGAFSRLAGGGSVKSIASSAAGSAYAERRGRRPQSARTISAGQSEASSGYHKRPLTGRGPRSVGGFSVSTASFSQDPYLKARQEYCSDVISDGGRPAIKPFKRLGLQQRGHDNLQRARHGSKPWLKGDIHVFNDAAGKASWEGSPQVKGAPFELDYLANQQCKASGNRHFPHHPLQRAHETQEAIHGYKFLDYRPPNHSKEEPAWVEPPAGKSVLEVTNSGPKLTKGSELNRGQVDRVMFGHDTYLRPRDHPQVDVGGGVSAGWPTWREGPGLHTTLKVTGALGSPDGYRRQGKKPKAPPSEGGESALSVTHDFRGRRHPEVSPTQTSVLKAVVFNGDKPLQTHMSQEFVTIHKGAAGKGSVPLGREQLKGASGAVTRHDQLSACSTEYGCRSLQSSQSVPALAATPRQLSVTSNALYGKDTRLHTGNRASPRF